MEITGIFLAVAIAMALIYFLMPKGIFLYEGTRLPEWLIRLNWIPKSSTPPTKLRYGNHKRQYVLYFPPQPGVLPKPDSFIYFHGSGWQYSRPELFRLHAKLLTAKGYHVFFPSHRRIPRYKIDDLREDARQAFLAIREWSAQNGLAKNRFILTGNSSGAHLSSFLVFDRAVHRLSGFDQRLFSALIFMGAPLDLTQMWPSPPLNWLAGKKGSATYQRANPINYLQPNEPLPILLIHGDKDGIVEHKSSLSFYEKAKQLQAQDITLVTLRGGSHLDSASWCFADHECCRVLFDWLENRERTRA